MGRRLLAGVLLLAAPACAGRSGSAEARSDVAPASVRFALEVTDTVPGPVWVLLNREDGQVGWVSVSRAGARIHLRERCDIEDCEAPGGVCGAALPVVRDLTAEGGAPSVEFEWDRFVSALDSTAGCERRVPAESGEYVARFCYASEASVDTEGDPAVGVLGRLDSPVCVERRFTLEQREVVLRL